MMIEFTYSELLDFIREDIEEFLADGLNIRQATSRIQVEYSKEINSNEFSKFVIFMILCEEGLKHQFLRDDIRDQTKEMLDQLFSENYKPNLNDNEIVLFDSQVVAVKRLLEI